MGACRIGDFAIVKQNLETYLALQNPKGSIPKRIAHPLYWMRYIGIPLSHDPALQRPTFRNSYLVAQSIAQDPILIIAFWDYIQQSGDEQFARDHIDQLHRVMEFLSRQVDEKELLKEAMGGGWAESVLKRGAISFTNMCYLKALWTMEEMSRQFGEEEKAESYRQRAERVRASIQKWLWSDDDGGYFSDWYGTHRHHHFATDGNLLAVWWDIATPQQAEKIQEKITALALEDEVPIRLAYDQYDFWRICIYNRVGGMKDYHVGFSWTWLGCVDAIAKQKCGEPALAANILERIADVIVRDGTVHEIYNKGKAVRTPLYKSENPWAWGAGIFLLACAELGYNLEEVK
ncbi:hypothetical protein KGQ71_00140 [Patescibacteria group bacterium]|nr:hypothetical protein [Patescibacteria group bacterium]